MSQATEVEAERAAVTAGDIAAINLESARQRSWNRFWRAPEQAGIAELIVEARRRFDVRGVKVIHRVGPLAVCDQIVLVVVSSAHRGDAFHCAEFLMDWLKTQAPFWKKESAGGESRWVDARISDDQAAARWGGLRTPPNVAQG